MSCILLVEDDADIRETLAMLLEDEGHDVVTAANGQTALHLLLQARHRPDIVILDLMMPVMNGWDLRKRMLEDPSVASIPTIVITGDPKAAHRNSTLAATAYLVKPFEADELIALVAGCR